MRCLLLAMTFLMATRADAAAEFLDDIRAGDDVTIATMGTSLTDTSHSTWVPAMTTWLKSESPNPANVTVLNEGVSSSSSDNGSFNLSGIDRQLPLVLGHNPDVVFIEFAINDAYTPYGISQAASVNNLHFIIDQLETGNPDVTIVLQTMNNPAGGALTSRPQIEAYYQGYRDVATSRDLLLIDHYPVWLDLFNNDRRTWNSYVPDTIHPIAAGTNAIILPGIQARLEAVPEPSSVALLGLGGLALLCKWTRRGRA